MVLGGYPLVGDPVFTRLESLEMKEVEKKLIHARQEPWRRKKGKASLSAWMDLFMNSDSELEHEAFLATWLSMVGFSHNSYVSKCVFPIVVHLARGNTIALGPAVLAGIYKDLSLLKKTIVGLTEKLVFGDKSELEETLHSPFYLVQIWVWERFKNLQPQPRWINHEEPMLCRWHKVKALKIDNVRLALDSAMEHFRWRPYVQHAGKFKVFYPENETLVPFETNLDKELVSYVTCLRASVLVGFQSTTKQYLPHRVAMQFGMDQDVPACVPRFYWTKEIGWKNYCRTVSDRNLYFPARHFEGDVTTRYAKWWKESVLSHLDFAKNVRQKRSMKPPHHGPHVSKANKNGNDADVPPGFPPNLGSTMSFGKSGDGDSNSRKGNSDPDVPSGFLPKHLKTVPSGSSVQDGLEGNENIDADVPKRCKNFSNQSSAASYVDCENVTVESWVGGSEEAFEDANVSKKSRLSSERVSLPSSQVESYSFASGITVMDLEQRINRLQTLIKKLKMAKFRHC